MIGEIGGEGVVALHAARDAQSLPTVSIRVTYRMSEALFEAITAKTTWPIDDGSGAGKKKKKGSTKKKK